MKTDECVLHEKIVKADPKNPNITPTVAIEHHFQKENAEEMLRLSSSALRSEAQERRKSELFF